ncbi:MAG TPA: FAD-dependent oxidoreductase [Candidatus Acidoferrales bacterium]|nr:FAD-dependent oxidoreductase [Candidatus Acidoferrales bacterium]
MRSARIVIVGAGFAGAASAYQLARRGARHVLLVEQERVAGYHASGRNASLVRQVIADQSTMALACRGAAFLRDLPADWPAPVEYRRNGSMLLACGASWTALQRDAERARALGVEAEILSRADASRRVEILEDAEFDGALWCPTDGVVDIHALLSGYLKQAASYGAEIRYGCRLAAVDTRHGRVSRILLDSDWTAADVLVDAAGAWAGEVAAKAGAVNIPLRPLRRHLFVTGPLSWVKPHWPFVWDVAHGFYFRPDSGGLLLCPCDEDEMAACDAPTSETALELLAEKTRRYFPRFSDLPIMKGWAGLRTFAPDGRFVIGWDPQLEGFFWVAALGGHGVTTSPAVGALVADMILDGRASPFEEMSPARFIEKAAR